MPTQECTDIIGRVFSSLQESGKRASIEGAKCQVVSLVSSFTASEVLEGILPPLRHILCHKSNNKLLQAYFELVTSLIIEFSHLSRSGTELCLMDEVLQEILRLSAVKNKVVRNRTCELLSHIVSLRGATQFRLGDWEENIYDCLFARTRDKISAVRSEALIGLSKFMDPSDTLCPCVARILWHVRHDASSDVRRKCLQLLPLTNDTLDSIVSRVADNSVEVKVATFKILTENIHLKYLKPPELMNILKIAHLEDSETVKVAFQNLLKKWLISLEGDTIFILQRMDLIGETDICSQTIQKLFNFSDLGAIPKLWHDLTGVDPTDLSPDGILGSATLVPSAISVEFSFFWVNLARFLHSNQTASQIRLECVVPDPMEFSEFLGKFQEYFLSQSGANSEQLRFIFENILTLLEFIDFSNESGRERIIVSLKTLITNKEFHLSLIEPSLRHFTRICPDVNARIMNLSSAIIAMNVSAPSPPRASDTSLLTQDSDTSLPLDAPESDTLDMNFRSLRITISLMRQVKIQLPDSHLLSLVQSVLIPNLLSSDFALRELALTGLALTSMTSLEMAHNVVPSFIMVATEALFLDHLSVQVAALCAILDLFLLYGDSILKMMSMLIPSPDSENPESEQEPNTSEIKQHILSLLLRILQSDCPELQKIALVGMCKLFLANRIRSCNLLGQLLIRSFHPVANTSVGLTEAIFAFFYSFTSKCHDNCVLLADSLEPTLWTVFEAPNDTFLSLVSLDAVCDKVLFFLSQRKCHNLLVEPLLTLCLSNPEAHKVCKSALRCLSQSDLRDFKHELPVLEHWGSLANQIPRDLVAHSFLRKFQEKIKDLNPEFEIVSPCHFVTPKCATSVTKSTTKKGYGRSSRKVDRVREPLTSRVKSQRHTKPINYTLDFSVDEDS